ncbi:MAG TPA: hypothetical protein PKW86_09100, partial [bacterium]|nr:hypothetical protein [bacterium]
RLPPSAMLFFVSLFSPPLQKGDKGRFIKSIPVFLYKGRRPGVRGVFEISPSPSFIKRGVSCCPFIKSLF